MFAATLFSTNNNRPLPITEVIMGNKDGLKLSIIKSDIAATTILGIFMILFGSYAAAVTI
jgi:hypothetical protein